MRLLGFERILNRLLLGDPVASKTNLYDHQIFPVRISSSLQGPMG